MPQLWQWSQISLKSVAAFKEQSSGKLVEPAGNKIQPDPCPPPPHHVMICLQSSPSLLQVLLSVNAGPGKISIEKKRLFKEKKSTLNPVSPSNIINLWCSNSPGVTLWWSAVVYFFRVPTFPQPASPTSTSVPHIPQNYFDHPQRRAVNSLLSITCGSRDAWIALKCYHSVVGKQRPSLKTSNWLGAAMHSGLFFVTVGVKIGLRVSFFSDGLLSVWLLNIRANCHSSKPDWILLMFSAITDIKLHWGC